MKSVFTKRFTVFFLVFLFMCPGTAMAQDFIDSVSPVTASPGDSDVEVTINLNSNLSMPPIPPSTVPIQSVTIGTLTAESSTRTSDYVVTAVFDFPADTTEGVFDVTVVFSGQQDDITMTESSAFTIGDVDTGGSDTSGSSSIDSSTLTYPIVDTGQTDCSSDSASISCPSSGADFYGQDAQHQGYQFSFRDNGDGTVSDLVTRLMWQQSTDSDGDGDIDADDKFTYAESQSYCENLTLAGYTDWRVPSIKESYSLIDHRGIDPSAYSGTDTSELTPFIDNTVFDYNWGDLDADERLIDSQYVSDTLYVDESASNSGMMFGVNFADGRIKGYGLFVGGSDKTFFCMCVRDNTSYGVNDFVDNSDGTITDNATGLMWSQDDNGSAMNWEDALAWVQTQNAANYMGYSDWRMPNIKELQSIVDYTRSPGTTNSAAIDPLFNATAITNEAGETDYPYYWSSTTHVAYPNSHSTADYISFGRAIGNMGDGWFDVHGAGAQRSDPKSPEDGVTYPNSHGPQGDAQRVYNYARLVRDVGTTSTAETGTLTVSISPQAASDAGAQWSVDGGSTWNDDGMSATLDAGTHTITFSTVTGYDSPADQSATVTAGETAAVTGTYTEQASTSDQTTGLFVNEAGAYDGYTLFAPMGSTDTYLIDNAGTVAHTWTSSYRPGLGAYLLENGNLLRTGNTNNATFNAGGSGGIVEQLDENGNVVWSYTQSSTLSCLHHDVEYLPSGNILMIAWEMKTQSEAVAAGRDSSLLSDGELWPDTIIEVDPSTNTVVWEWHVWDHLVQDIDSTKPNFGVVADHPELVDLNYTTGPNAGADWTHFNSVEYIEDYDQIVVSVHSFSEIWVIDHSTTTAEAASHSGGTYGKGGDLLYRWGNPEAYGAGNSADQELYSQHDASWTSSGSILIYNNGKNRPAGDYSTIDEITPPVDASGNYTLSAGSAYGPDSTTWTYTASTPTDFYSQNISGAQRLPNGNTLICEGATGTFFEVTESGTTVWEYVNPVTDSGVLGTTDEIPTTAMGDQTNQVFNVKRYATDYSGLPGSSPTTGTGSLTVTLTPSGAIDAGALWTVDDRATWNDSGTVLDLTPGDYTLIFKKADGYRKPSTQTVTVTAGGQTSVTGEYRISQATGTLLVSITPSEAVDAGAQWMLDDSGEWKNSGDLVMDVEEGSHTVTFKAIDGWTAPENQTVEITDGGTAMAEGVYTEAAPAPACNDGVQNGNETGVDCGGDCDPCPVEDSSDDDCFIGTAVWD